MRVAAVGDVHLGEDLRGRLRPQLAKLSEAADVLLLAGDLTQHGTVAEAQVVAEEFAGLGVPVAAVLGNHDYHSGQEAEITKLLTDSGMTVLEGSGSVFDLPGGRLGVAGSKGFGGGFPGRCASEFGEPEMKAFVRHSKELAASLAEALRGLDAEARIALTHYAPVPDTLAGEPPEIYAFLGSYFLAEAADACGADLMLHGHAHAGTEKGLTPGGVAVRNVALPVLNCAYAVYCLASATPVDCADQALHINIWPNAWRVLAGPRRPGPVPGRATAYAASSAIQAFAYAVNFGAHLERNSRGCIAIALCSA